MRMCSKVGLWIALDYSWVRRPLIPLLHHRSGYPIGPDWWVSTESDREENVCDGRRLLISLDWLWVHRPVILLLQSVYRYMIDQQWWMSTGNVGDVGAWWKKIVDLTRLIFSASATDLAASQPMRFDDRSRVVIVYREGWMWETFPISKL